MLFSPALNIINCLSISFSSLSSTIIRMLWTVKSISKWFNLSLITNDSFKCHWNIHITYFQYNKSSKFTIYTI